MEAETKHANQSDELQKSLSLLTLNLESSKVQVESLEKRVKDKERKIKDLDDRIADMQDQQVIEMNNYNKDVASNKQMSDHQVAELKKRIDEVEETAQTYKSQL